MQLGTEDKQKSLKRLIIVFLIFFAILAIALSMLYFDKIKQLASSTPTTNLQPNPQPVGQENQQTSQPAPLSAAEIEKIKTDVVTGKLQDAPPALVQLGQDKELIIEQYLYDCYMKTDLGERVKCYDLYYMNNDASYVQQKQSCEKLSGTELNHCLDALYYNASAYLGANLCPAIKDQALQETCLTSIK